MNREKTCKNCKHISACEGWTLVSLASNPIADCERFQDYREGLNESGFVEAACGNCSHYNVCYEWNNNQHPQKGQLWICGHAGNCLYFNPSAAITNIQRDKICPFRHDNVQLGSASCIGSDCAWWDASNNNCVVFRPVWDAADSLNKEIETVLHGGIIQGGED